MRIATWNVNSLKARMPRVVDWVARFNPSVLCLQETKMASDASRIPPSKRWATKACTMVKAGGMVLRS